MKTNSLTELVKLVRYNILTATTAAGSGHPTSSLSATELLTTLFFGGYLHYDLDNPKNVMNDRVIFSKGHASPLLYALYGAAGVVSHEELLTLRQFTSRLEGHPTPEFKYIDVATGSLGQGLSAGFGMALAIKRYSKEVRRQTPDVREPKVWVLLGDSEMAEGQVWEAMELAGHYKTNNLVGILDVNRLGQRGETMLGWDVETYKKRAESFGWKAIVLENGNDLQQTVKAFEEIENSKEDKPTMIIAKTKKGNGISLLENLDNWHGKALPKEKLEAALKELGPVDLKLTGTVNKPNISEATGGAKRGRPTNLGILNSGAAEQQALSPDYEKKDLVATREAYGHVLPALCAAYDNVVVLDAETSNSTYSETVKKDFPDRFYEMYIAEQNMVSAAVGMSKLGFNPFVSSFATFFTRAFDQIRMGQYSEANIKIVGSHAGVSIGSDGSSQMALEDIAMMQSILNSIIFYPSDAVSMYKIIELIASKDGIFYVRSTREKTPILYSNDEKFVVGGSKILKQSKDDIAVVFAAGITLHEALKAYDQLAQQGKHIAIVDLYSIKPLDEKTVNALAKKTGHVIVVEDHYPYGGIGEAVSSALMKSGVILNSVQNPEMPKQVRHDTIKFTHLAVSKIPHSGTPAELLRYENIDAQAIIEAVK